MSQRRRAQHGPWESRLETEHSEQKMRTLQLWCWVWMGWEGRKLSQARAVSAEPLEVRWLQGDPLSAAPHTPAEASGFFCDSLQGSTLASVLEPLPASSQAASPVASELILGVLDQKEPQSPCGPVSHCKGR